MDTITSGHAPGEDPKSLNMLDVEELTVTEYHRALREKRTTVGEAVSAYLGRIADIDPKLKSFIHLSQDCLETAQRLDQWLENSQGSQLPLLFGVPIILKDTYSTLDLPTTVGSQSLQGLQGTDAFVVTKLKVAGAIIMGKGNVHEFCLQGCTFSSLGSQTLNPYDLTRTPGGSSGGTAAAVAANLAMLGCGGDTMNSIRSPASACNLVGLRPTMGQISRAGIVPVAWSQDAIGPIGRTVQDVRLLFQVMEGEDPDDEVTVNRQRGTVVQQLDGRKLRIGLIKSYFPSDAGSGEGKIVQEVMDNGIQKLTEMATFLDVDEDDLPISFSIPSLLSDVDVQVFEMRTAIDEFLSSKYVTKTPHKTIASIAQSGDFNKLAVTEVFWNTLKPGFDTKHPEYQERLERMKVLREALQQCFRKHSLDAIAFPHQKRLVMEVGTRVQLDRNGILASLTGFPSLCIPVGFSPPTETVPQGIPVGMELLAEPWSDMSLLDIGERAEKILQMRKSPVFTSV